MKLQHVWLVFRKELLDTLRDRRTLLGLIVLPVLLMPIMMLGMPLLMQNRMDKVEEEAALVAVLGREYSHELVTALESSPLVRLIDSSDPQRDLQEGRLQAVLLIPEGFDESLQRGEPLAVQVVFDASLEKSTSAQRKVSTVLESFSMGKVSERLAALGVDVSMLTPFTTQLVNVAPEEKMGNTILAFLLPLVIGIWASLGGMYTAIDVAAGEKERGTLEQLLATPPSRVSMVTGKYLAVVATSMFSATLSLASLILSIAVAPQALMATGGEQLAFVLPPATLGMFFIASLLLSGFFSAVSIVLSVFARSFKEAQVYLSPLSFVVIVPAFLTQFVAPAEAPLSYFLLPIVNCLMLMKGSLLGGLTVPLIVAAVVSSLLYIAVGLWVTVAMFSKEDILFRT